MTPLDYKEKMELSQLVEDDSSLFFYTINHMTAFYTDSVDTVSSTYSKKANQIKLLINKEYWDSIDFIERRFLLSHQCLHVILEHYGRIGEMKGANPELLDISMDLVVNHLLINRFGFRRQDLTGEYFWVDGVFKDATKEFLDYVASKYKTNRIPTNLSLEDYYDLLVKMQPEQDSDQDGDSEEQGSDGSDSKPSKGSKGSSGDESEDSESDPSEEDGEQEGQGEESQDGKSDKPSGKSKKSSHIEDLDDPTEPGGAGGEPEDRKEQGAEGSGGDEQEGSGGDEEGSEDDANTAGDHDFSDKIPKHIMESIAKDFQKTATEEDLKKAKEMFSTTPGNGKGSVGDPLIAGSIEKTIESLKLKVVKKKRWDSIIKRWDVFSESENEEYQFVHEDRRFACVDRSFDFPQKAEIISRKPEKLNLMFFLDSSGSCEHLADRFFKAAKSLDPKKFNVRLFSRTTEVKELFPDKNGNYRVSGYGSDDFSCIERFIQDELKSGALKRYPEGIFHVTDGHDCSDTMVNPEKPKNWHWFITEDGTTQYIPKQCNIYNLKDFE